MDNLIEAKQHLEIAYGLLCNTNFNPTLVEELGRICDELENLEEGDK